MKISQKIRLLSKQPISFVLGKMGIWLRGDKRCPVEKPPRKENE